MHTHKSTGIFSVLLQLRDWNGGGVTDYRNLGPDEFFNLIKDLPLGCQIFNNGFNDKVACRKGIKGLNRLKLGLPSLCKPGIKSCPVDEL